jgi:hypothetical protein
LNFFQSLNLYKKESRVLLDEITNVKKELKYEKEEKESLKLLITQREDEYQEEQRITEKIVREREEKYLHTVTEQHCKEQVIIKEHTSDDTVIES